jgi:hypothetical protein
MFDLKEHLRHDIPDAAEHAASIVKCLEYMASEAEEVGLSFPAHLIRTGARSVQDSIALVNIISGTSKVA